MSVYLIGTTQYNPWNNLAVEEYLLGKVRPGDVMLYLWQNQNTVVIGKNQNPWRECRVAQLEQDGGFLARRSSGGGAVFHDLGNLCFTFLTSPEGYDLTRQLGVILRACRMHGIAAEFSGRNDILAEGRKFSGNAFQFTKTASLQHGTLLVDADMQKLGQYLVPSKEKMRSKGVASVRARVCNLTEFSPSLTTEALRVSLAEAFEAEYGTAQVLHGESLDEAAVTALYDKYSSWAWRYGETLRFGADLTARFAWGGVEIALRLKNAAIEDVKVYSDAMDADLAGTLENVLRGCAYGLAMAQRMQELADVADEDRGPVYADLAEWLREKEF